MINLTEKRTESVVFVGPQRGKRGRPRKGNVLFARRVPKDKIPELIAVLTAARINGPWYVPATKSPEEVARDLVKGQIVKTIEQPNQSANVKALLDDIEILNNQVLHWQAEYNRAMALSDDMKVHYWRTKCLAMEKAMNDGSS